MTYECKVNTQSAIDWQRGSAPALIKKLQLKEQWYIDNHCSFWENWVRDVFDLRTANEFGLIVWSVILDFPVFQKSGQSRPGYPAIYFGQFRKNFGRGNFGKNDVAPGNLSKEQTRVLLQLKAMIINMSSSMPEINRKLAQLFGNGAIYAIDNKDMSITYSICDPKLKQMKSIIEYFDLFPRPSTVKVIISDGE